METGERRGRGKRQDRGEEEEKEVRGGGRVKTKEGRRRGRRERGR